MDYYAKRLKEWQSLITKTSNRCHDESNKWEFEIVRLMLQAAAGSIVVYASVVYYKLLIWSSWPLLCWIFSMIFGVFHLLRWVDVVERLGKKGYEISSRIEILIFDHFDDKLKLKDAHDQWLEEIKDYNAKCLSLQKSEVKYDYILPNIRMNIWTLYLQGLCLILGVCFVLSKIEFKLYL